MAKSKQPLRILVSKRNKAGTGYDPAKLDNATGVTVFRNDETVKVFQDTVRKTKALLEKTGRGFVPASEQKVKDQFLFVIPSGLSLEELASQVGSVVEKDDDDDNDGLPF